jgi:hypothetical protein
MSYYEPKTIAKLMDLLTGLAGSSETIIYTFGWFIYFYIRMKWALLKNFKTKTKNQKLKKNTTDSLTLSNWLLSFICFF